jgi:hypothetical protein
MRNNFMEEQIQGKPMPCGYLDDKKGDAIVTLDELKGEGWEIVNSFHATIAEQWNMAAEEVARLQRLGMYEVGLARGQGEAEQRDGVTYVVRKAKQ